MWPAEWRVLCHRGGGLPIEARKRGGLGDIGLVGRRAEMRGEGGEGGGWATFWPAEGSGREEREVYALN